MIAWLKFWWRELLVPFIKTHVASIGVIMLLMAARAFAADLPCPSTLPIRLALPATREAVIHDNPITVVALGSSSTQGAGASTPDHTYPARLEALLRATWPGAKVVVKNRGIGGETIDAILERLDADVIAARPTLVIWQVGTNEILRGMDLEKFDAMLD